jgi:spermidine/putrescine transport system permease protein
VSAATTAGARAALLDFRVVLAALAYGLPITFILVPLALFLLQSFYYVHDGEIVRQLTMRNYVRIFADPIYLPMFVRSCGIALGASVITVALGYPVALLLASLPERWKRVMTLVFVIPLVMSYIIKIYAIRAILGSNGFLNRILFFFGIIDQPLTFLIFNLQAVMLTLAVILLPFAILPVLVALDKIPRGLLEASADLGATPLQTFRRVVLPLSLQGTLVGASFTFVLALGDFVTPQMVGGMSGFTFGRIIYSQFGFAFNWPFGAALSVMLMGTVLVALFLTSRLVRTRRRA